MGQLTNQFVSQSFQGLLNLANANTGFTANLQTITDGLGGSSALQMSQTQVNISGTFTVNGSPVSVDTGSFVTTSSFNAFTSSIDGRVDALEVETGSLQNQINGLATTGSLNSYTLTSSFNSYTSSNDSKVNSLIAGTGSYATTSSLTSLSQSIATTDLGQNNRLGSIEQKTGSYATTGSNQFNGNQSITGSIRASSTVTSLDGFVGGYLQSTTNLTVSADTLVDIKTNTTGNNGKVRLYSNGNNPFKVEVSGSLNVRDGITGSLQGTASYATQALSASYAPDNSNRNGLITTGSVGGTQSITGSLGISGTLTATSASITYLETVYETASIIYSSGSNQFGDASNDTQTLWGTVNLPSGALLVTGSVYLTDIKGTGSLFLQPNQADARFVEIYNTSPTDTHITASGGQIFLGDDQTYVKVDNYGSVERIDIVAGNELNVSSSVINVTGSLNAPSITGSLQGSASYATNAMSASQAQNADTASYVLNAVSSSYSDFAVSSSFATNAGSASYAPTIIPDWVATTGSNVFVGAQTINNDLTINSSNPFGTFVNMISTGTTSFNMDSPTTQFQSNGLISFTNTLSSTGSSDITFLTQNGGDITFNTSNSGSVAITGSVIVKGPLDIRSGSLDLFSNGTTINTDLYLTNSLGGQSNIIQGWGDNPQSSGAGAVQANYTGSLTITGSNNIVSMPQIRATAVGGGTDLQGYISGSGNIITSNFAGIYLNTGSLLFPKTQGNILGNGSSIQMNFTTSSIAGGHPGINNNLIMGGTITLNSNSGSATVATNAILGGAITSTQNFVTNARSQITSNNIIGSVTLNHLSSSINFLSNYNNATVTVNNAVSSSITNNSLSVSNNAFLGASHNIFASGSQNSNIPRQIQNNLIGGANINISSSFVSSSNSNLYSTIAYGNNLLVSASHNTGTLGGSAFVGRFNDTGSLALAQDIVFAVGTGTAAANRRTGLWITSGSAVGISGSLNISGSVNIGSAGPVNISGSQFNTNNYIVWNGAPTVPGTLDNFVGAFMTNRNSFVFNNIVQSSLTSGSNFTITTDTGSNYTNQYYASSWGGTEARFTIGNSSGFRSSEVVVDQMNITGSLGLSGSLAVTGDVKFASGSNKTMGTFVLDGANPGAATVSNSLVSATSLIFLTKQTNVHSGNGTVSVTSKGTGTFSVTSNHNGDTDTVAYLIINPS
jgi:hypothetical protein